MPAGTARAVGALAAAIALAAACTPAPTKPAVRSAATAPKPSESASSAPSSAPSAAPGTPDPAASAAASAAPVASGSAGPAASSQPAIAATPYTGAPGLAAAVPFSGERPNALVNYDTGEIVWVPANPAMTWEVKGLGQVALAKARVTLGSSSLLDAGYRLLQDGPLPTNPVAGPTLDPSFVPPSAAPRPTPLASMLPFDPGTGAQLSAFELALDQLGLPAALRHDEARAVTLKVATPEIETFIRSRKPVGAVDVEIVLLEPGNSPVMDPLRPTLLSGRIQIK